jgi:hypothetical protein
MGKRAADFRGLILPVSIALVLTLIYFFVTNGWTRLANPIPGIVSVIAGVIGFAAGVALDRQFRSRQAPEP